MPGLRARFINCALLLLRALIDADAGSECRTVPRAVESAILKAVVTTVAATNKSADEHAILTTLSSTLSGADARAPDAVVDAVARPFLDTIIDTDAAAHGTPRVFKASAAWRMDSGVMSPGLGGIIWRRVVRGAGGSTKACAVAAAKHSLRSSMVS